MELLDVATVMMGRCDALLTLTDEIRKMNVPRLEKRLGTLRDKLLDERLFLAELKPKLTGEVEGLIQEEKTE